MSTIIKVPIFIIFLVLLITAHLVGLCFWAGTGLLAAAGKAVANQLSQRTTKSPTDNLSVREYLTRAYTMAPILFDSDPAVTMLLATRRAVEERANAATLEILSEIEQTFRR